MANERDLELLDDYLSNRMGGSDRSEFEQKMQADPDLRSEFSLQKALVQRIRDARVAELKSMLDNVAIPAGGSSKALTSKAIIGVVTILLAAATVWFVTRHETTKVVMPAPSSDERKTTDERPVPAPDQPEVTKKQGAETQVQKQRIETDKNQTSAGTEDSNPSLAKKPAPLSPPVEKRDSEKSSDASSIMMDKTAILRPATSLAIEPREDNSYPFHYQFRDGKLLLYGPFKEKTYELMEWSTGEKRVFLLYYNKDYYPLTNVDGEVEALTPVTDASLLERLNQSRSRQ
jgi:hypothetical protein